MDTQLAATAKSSGALGGAALKGQKERDAAKAELAKKAGVPLTFQWPDKKVEIPLEATGAKDLDEEDGLVPQPDRPPAAAAAPAAVKPAFSFDAQKSAVLPAAAPTVAAG